MPVSPEFGLRAVLRRGILHVGPSHGRLPLHLVPDGHGRLIGAVYGALSPSEAADVVRNLNDRSDPGGPDAPWIAVSLVDDGGFAGSASMMMTSGLFWCVDGESIAIASDPRASATALWGSTRMDTGYIRQYSLGVVPPTATPYLGVHRVPAGHTVRWPSPGDRVRIFQWCGPDTFGEPSLRGSGSIEVYREVFDHAVSTVRARTPSAVTTTSGGLDSTFVTATLALEASKDEPVVAYCYSPLPAAHLQNKAGWEADEIDLAKVLEARYRGRLVVNQVRNTNHVRPLSAAAEASAQSGLPTYNVANSWWIAAIRELATTHDSSMWFMGTNGNAAFSHNHTYAAAFALRRMRPWSLAALSRADEGQWSLKSLRSQVLSPLARRYRRSGPDPTGALDRFMMLKGRPPVHPGRPQYLAWLSRNRDGLPAQSNPSAHFGVPPIDPFTSRAVVELAASISPETWYQGRSRGFAREAARDRVPDEIRLRSRRGQQGRDAWYVIRNDRDEYLDRIGDVANVAGLEHVNCHALSQYVSAWPWGEVKGPDWAAHVALDRLLALAEFASQATDSAAPKGSEAPLL